MMSLFKTEDYSGPEPVKTVYGSIRKFLNLKKKKEEIKDKIIGDIKALFKQEDDYYKPTIVGSFLE